MTDGIHTEVETDTGRLRLLCNAAEFERLSGWLREQAKVTNLVTVPATEFRVVSVELVTEEETPPGMGKQLASYGCAIVLASIFALIAIGMYTVFQWLAK